jgi:phosphoglycerate dehydrogenase-like enzyme
VCRLAAPFPWRRIGHDAYADPVEGVDSVSLQELFEQSDYLVVTLPLTDETWHIVNAQTLALMRPTAQLVNIARGPVVDQDALTEALAAGRLGGAALDVFDPEPLPVDHPLIAMDNVILTGHDAGLTDDMTRDIAASVCRSVIEVARGEVPAMLLNRDVLDHPRVAALVRS